MSYARWGGGSEWYIYWSTTSGATIDAQRLDMKQEFPHPGRPRVIRKHQNRNSR
jgi:hypothetical protein